MAIQPMVKGNGDTAQNEWPICAKSMHVVPNACARLPARSVHKLNNLRITGMGQFEEALITRHGRNPTSSLLDQCGLIGCNGSGCLSPCERISQSFHAKALWCLRSQQMRSVERLQAGLS